MEVTKNGKNKITEKIGIPKKSIDRQFKLALERGFRQNQIKGHLKKWVTSKVLLSKHPKKGIVYNNHLFIMTNNEKLITVITLPSNLSRDVNKFLIK